MNRIRLLLLLILICLSGLKSIAQVLTFTDERDSRTYQYKNIAGLNWMMDDLKYLSTASWCIDKSFENDEHICGLGNFYKVTEIEQVCPLDWRLPTIKEWTDLMEEFIAESKDDSTNIEYGLNESSMDTTYKYFRPEEGFEISEEYNFALKGWVQGKKLKVKGQDNYWVAPNDNKKAIHVHIGQNGFTIHSHAHHIYDKEKKQRKFSIRCVSEL